MSSVRQKKMLWVIGTLVGTIIAVALILYAIRSQTNLYYDPSDIVAGVVVENTTIRAGGLVVAGSVVRDYQQVNNPLDIEFQITDCIATVVVHYQGILPDLFTENSGVVATGQLQGKTFIASQILAKHDENYMPPEVANSMKDQHENGLQTCQNPTKK